MCAQFLTNAKDIASTFDLLCSKAEFIEALLPQLSPGRAELWSVIQKYAHQIKTLVTLSNVEDISGWPIFYHTDALRLLAGHDKSIPLSIWYFHHDIEPSLIVASPNLMNQSGVDVYSVCLHFYGPNDSTPIQQGRRWIHEQKRTAQAPLANVLIGEKPSTWIPLDAQIESLHPIRDIVKLRSLAKKWFTQITQTSLQHPEGSCVYYLSIGIFWVKIIYTQYDIHLSWSHAQRTDDSATHWDLKIILPFYVSEVTPEHAGFAIDLTTQRIFFVVYVENENFWDHSRWRGTHVEHNGRARRAVVLAQLDSSNMQEQILSFTEEFFRLSEILKPIKDSDHYDYFTQSNQEWILPPITDTGKIYTFEHLDIDNRALLLQRLFALHDPITTDDLLCRAPDYLMYLFRFAVMSNDTKGLLLDALTQARRMELFNVTIINKHTYWQSMYKQSKTVTMFIWELAVLYSCSDLPMTTTTIIKQTRQTLNNRLKTQRINKPNISQSIQQAIDACISKKLLLVDSSSRLITTSSKVSDVAHSTSDPSMRALKLHRLL